MAFGQYDATTIFAKKIIYHEVSHWIGKLNRQHLWYTKQKSLMENTWVSSLSTTEVDSTQEIEELRYLLDVYVQFNA